MNIWFAIFLFLHVMGAIIAFVLRRAGRSLVTEDVV